MMNPETIPPRLLSKCKQILLSPSPIITKTCWNRRFGGDVRLCSVATNLLMTAELLQEGNFVARRWTGERKAAIALSQSQNRTDQY